VEEEERVTFIITTDGSGDPTLTDSGRGKIASVAKSATGRYKLTLDHKYKSVVMPTPILKQPTDQLVGLYAEDVDGSTPYVEFQIYDVSGAALADLISGEIRGVLHLRQR